MVRREIESGVHMALILLVEWPPNLQLVDFAMWVADCEGFGKRTSEMIQKTWRHDCTERRGRWCRRRRRVDAGQTTNPIDACQCPLPSYTLLLTNGLTEPVNRYFRYTAESQAEGYIVHPRCCAFCGRDQPSAAGNVRDNAYL
jgi:hypothetical protein